jgi:predicted DNA-binding protein
MRKEYNDKARRYVLQIRLTEEEHDTLNDLSDYLGRDKSDIVREAIAQFIERQTTRTTNQHAAESDFHRSLNDKGAQITA